MRRFRKLLGMVFIFGVVFFIICDEKGYKIGFKNNQIVFNKTEKKSDLEFKEDSFKEIVYKNSDWIHINYEFENPRNLRKSDGMNSEYLAKIKQEKKLEEEKFRNLEKPGIVSLGDNDTISSVFQGKQTQKQNTGVAKTEVKQNTGVAKTEVKQNIGVAKTEVKQNTGVAKTEVKQNTGAAKTEVKQNTGAAKTEVKQNTGAAKIGIILKTGDLKEDVYYPIKKYEHKKVVLNLGKGVNFPVIDIERYSGKEKLSLNLFNGKILEPKILYKNSNKIKLYSGFENPWNMRSSLGIDENFLVKQENKSIIIGLNNNDTISSVWRDDGENIDNIQYISGDSYYKNQDINQSFEENIGSINEVDGVDDVDNKEIVKKEKEDIENQEYKDVGSDFDFFENEGGKENGNNEEKGEEIILGEEVGSRQEIKYKVEKYEYNNHLINISKGILSQKNIIAVNRPKISNHGMNMSEGKISKDVLVKIDKYEPINHNIILKKGVKLEHNFEVENIQEIQQSEGFISDSLLENLLEDEEINIDTLESENDEFLQKVFEKTKDRDVMNLIVETYLNEYQFVKAKKFIENLPDEYRNELKPSLDLRVAFNSFALSSKTISDNLNSLLQKYISKNEISTEDKNRYLGIITLIDRDYDKFFEISAGFTSEKNKNFASKLQGYKEQIAKQMGMPEYYFDTLVSLELFNQGLFQPAKVLALYSLQKNPNYILPHQVLAYANFLTNSWDISIEYLKKLIDLDPNNAEKYRFLMGVSSYWDEKYEQSVVMLSMIKDEELRLDTQRYLVNNYLKLDQKNKLISTWNKLLGSENLVASDFYTYFYETFFHPYSEGKEFQIYAFDPELANKMLRVCSITLQNEDKAVCTYGTIGRNIAKGQFDGLEQYLLDLVAEYPQGYLYQALGDYYIQQGDLEKAKVYLIKAISLTQNNSERSQIKKLLQDVM